MFGLKSDEVNSIMINGPMVKDLFGLDFSSSANLTENMCILIGRISDISKEDAENLSLKDFNIISSYIGELVK